MKDGRKRRNVTEREGVRVTAEEMTEGEEIVQSDITRGDSRHGEERD